MKPGKTTKPHGNDADHKGSAAINSLEHSSSSVNTISSGAEKRRSMRLQIFGINLLAPRTRLLLDADGNDAQSCRIRDVSDRGYRVALTRELKVPIGTEIMLEHTDGWRRRVRVCWTFGNESGLEIIGTNTYVILGTLESDVHECEIIATSELGYRITVATKPKMVGNFLLELANGSRRKVFVRWSFRDEFGLQLVDLSNPLA